MKTLPTCLAVLLVAYVMMGLAQAQPAARPPIVIPAGAIYNMPYPYSNSTGLVPSWHGHRWWDHGWWYHGSTAAESYLRGVAAVTRARGEYNLMTSQASIYNEEARRLSLENHTRTVQTYYDGRKMNREARAAERGPRATQEDLTRLAKTAAPSRLNDTQFNPATGRIAWPAALRGDEYAAHRAEIEALFVQRASSGSIGPQQRDHVGQATGTMLVLLKGQIRELSPMEYSTARRFLESLTYEAQLTTG
jgi:hypothetical protein